MLRKEGTCLGRMDARSNKSTNMTMTTKKMKQRVNLLMNRSSSSLFLYLIAGMYGGPS